MHDFSLLPRTSLRVCTPYLAFVDFDEPEPREEFDDDEDCDDDEEDHNVLTDWIGSK